MCRETSRGLPAERSYYPIPFNGSQHVKMANNSKRQRLTGRETQARPLVQYKTDLFELWVNGNLVKRLDIRATNQLLILTVFQEENWPDRIDDPLPPNGGDDKARLRSAIHCLNGHQARPIIHFFADGTGRGIRWELAPLRT